MSHRNNPVTVDVLRISAAGESSRAGPLLEPPLAQMATYPDSRAIRRDFIVIDDRPREFLQLSDGRYVRVTSTDDGELMPVEEPVKPQRARSGSASNAEACSSHVTANAPGCGLRTFSDLRPRRRAWGWGLAESWSGCHQHRHRPNGRGGGRQPRGELAARPPRIQRRRPRPAGHPRPRFRPRRQCRGRAGARSRLAPAGEGGGEHDRGGQAQPVADPGVQLRPFGAGDLPLAQPWFADPASHCDRNPTGGIVYYTRRRGGR